MQQQKIVGDVTKLEVDPIESGVVGYRGPDGNYFSWLPQESFPGYFLQMGCTAYLDRDLFHREAAIAMGEDLAPTEPEKNTKLTRPTK